MDKLILNRLLIRRELLKVSGLGALGAAVFLLNGCAKGSSSHSGRDINRRARIEVPSEALNFDVAEGFDKLNKVRRRNWLPDFHQDQRLQAAAQNYADLMGSRGLYGHEIGPGTDFKTRIFAVGFDHSAGENLGVGYGSIDEAIQGWLDSPAHKKNMLKARYSLAGLAYAYNTSGKNDRYTHFWVLIMGADD